MDHNPSRILIVEDDTDTADVLAFILQDQGYQITKAISLQQAYDILDRESFDFILSDIMDTIVSSEYPHTQALVDTAFPIPVGILSARLHPDEVLKNLTPIVFTLVKPFNIDDLMNQISDYFSGKRRLSPQQVAYCQTVERYFGAIMTADWETLRALCTEDVRYSLQSAPAPVSGRDTYIAYVQEIVRNSYHQSRFFDTMYFPMLDGLMVRFLSEWIDQDGQTIHCGGGTTFKFRQGKICQIGVDVPRQPMKSH